MTLITLFGVHGENTLLYEKTFRLSTLAIQIKSMCGMGGPLNGAEQLTAVVVAEFFCHRNGEEDFLVRDGTVIIFLENVSFCTLNDLYNLEFDERDEVMKTTLSLMLTFNVRVFSLWSERSSTNAPTEHTLPPILPAPLYHLRPMQLYDVMEMQKRMTAVYAPSGT